MPKISFITTRHRSVRLTAVPERLVKPILIRQIALMGDDVSIDMG